MKRPSLLLAVLILSISIRLFAGCDRSPDYREDADIEEIADTLTPLLSHPETLMRYDADQIHFFLGLPEPYCDDSVVMVQTRSDSVDEYGVFLCPNEEEADELEELLDDYLELTIPGKLAYLDDCGTGEGEYEEGTDSARSADRALTGRVKRYGLWVCYTLLDDEEDDTLQEALKKLLREA